MSIPYIHREDNQVVEIIGDSENMKALGEMLILKSKMKERFIASMRDKDGNEINLIIEEEVL